MAEPDLRSAARAFVHNPEECSFESLYRMIWETWHQENGKEELQAVIRELLVEICEEVMAIQSETDHIIELWKHRFDYFTHHVRILINAFVFYETAVDNPEDRIAIRSRKTVQEMCLQSTSSLQMQAGITELYRSLFEQCQPLPEFVAPVAHFMSRASPELYELIFERGLEECLERHVSSMTFPPEDDNLVAMLYSMCTTLEKLISERLEPNASQVFRAAFKNFILKKLSDRLVAREMLIRCHEDFELLRQLHAVITLGDTDLQNRFADTYATLLHESLEQCFEKNEDDFDAFATCVARSYSENQEIIQECFGNDQHMAVSIHRTFVKFLDEKRFGHELCVYADKKLVNEYWLSILGKFIANDVAFQEEYTTFLARRLLGWKPNPKREEKLLRIFSNAEVMLEGASSMINDFNQAERSTATDFNRDLLPPCFSPAWQMTLTVLFSAAWPMLHAAEFTLPEPLSKFYNLSLAARCHVLRSLGESSDRSVAGVHMLSSLEGVSEKNKNVYLSDRYSLVEFTRQERYKKRFSLPLAHACIVIVVMQNGTGSIESINNVLGMKKPDLKAKLDSLVKCGILSLTDGDYQFEGPPTGDVDEESEPVHADEDELMYSNVRDQIEAATVRFLKPRRYATFAEIREAVLNAVPRRFPITDDKIRLSLEKLLERSLIIEYHGEEDAYRYCK